ncbi:MAG: EamA/RhaT family transporter [Bacteroidales bacterium]|jgi:drug/metabolite transporter (DMT)-like permease|nr:EamA/RhaT family transporter [Bacteroidales bacterium]
MKAKGYIYAALSAAAYGTNPIFAKPLYNDGMNPDSVLLFRYVLAVAVLALMMSYNGFRRGNLAESFRVSRHNLPQLILLGVLMAFSSLTLFVSYNYIPVGIASTLLFVYPILTALIMTLCFHERLSWLVVVCLVIACSGIALLCPMEDGAISLSSNFLIGFLVVMLSGLSYAIYLVGLNKTRLRTIASMPVTLYVLIFGTLLFVVRLMFFAPLTLPEHTISWLNLLALGIFPTVVSLICTAKAIQNIGSTQTALLGALEPVTAVILGVIILGETVSLRDIGGMTLIFLAVTLVVYRKK